MEELRVDALKELAKRAGVRKGITRKGELIASLNRLLQDNLAGVVQLLTPVEKHFLAEAAHNRGRVEPSMFAAKYQQRCPHPDRWANRRNVSLIHLLIAEDEYSNAVVVPQEILEPLRGLLPEPAEVTVETVDDLPPDVEFPNRFYDDRYARRKLHQFFGERTAWLELRRVLSLVQAGKVRVQDKSRRPTAAAERVIGESLSAPDFDLEVPGELRDSRTAEAGPVRAHAWAVLVQQCGWCRPRNGLLTLTKEGKTLLGNIGPEDYRKGVDRLVADDYFDELNRVDHIRGQSGKGKRYLTHPSERREAIVMAMCQWPVNRWIGLREAHRFTYASGNELCVTSYPYHFYFSERRYGYLSESASLNCQYTRVFLLESLATLGLVDVAYVFPHYLWPEFAGWWGTDDMGFCGRYDGLLFVRLNPLGAWCLGVTDGYEPPEAERRELFTVLPNRELALTSQAKTSMADIGMLELFAKKRSDRLWRLDEQRILAFVEGGGSADEVQRYLEQNSAVPIPETVGVFLADVQAKTDTIIGTQDALLLEVKDAHTAALIANDAKARKYCYLAGERHLAVIKKNERAFRTALKKLGYVLPQ
jgi:hypothetical protein